MPIDYATPDDNDLTGKHVVVIGGGRVSTEKARNALRHDATVLVVAPHLSPELRELWREGKVDWRPASWVTGDLDGIDIVLAEPGPIDTSL